MTLLLQFLVSSCSGIAETSAFSVSTDIFANMTSSTFFASSSSISTITTISNAVPSSSIELQSSESSTPSSMTKATSTPNPFSVSGNYTHNPLSSTSSEFTSQHMSSVTGEIGSSRSSNTLASSTIDIKISNNVSSTVSSRTIKPITTSSNVLTSRLTSSSVVSSVIVTRPTVSSRSLSTIIGSSSLSASSSPPDSYNSPYASSISSPATFPSSSAPSTSADLVAQASLIISQDQYGRFCSQYLGYQSPKSSVRYVTTVIIDTTITTSVGTSTLSSDYTELNIQTVPTVSTTVVETLTVTYEATRTNTITDATTQVFSTTASASIDNAQGGRRANPPKTPVEKRALGDSTLSVPPELTAFAPSIISSACSKNAVRPTVLGTQTVVSTVSSSHYITAPAGYAVAVHTVQVSSRVRSGIFSTTSTATPKTVTRTRTITTTTYQTILATSTKILFPSNIPTAYLANPTPIAGNANGALRPVDDEFFAINLPFDMQLYDHSSSRIFVSSNGVSIYHVNASTTWNILRTS